MVSLYAIGGVRGRGILRSCSRDLGLVDMWVTLGVRSGAVSTDPDLGLTKLLFVGLCDVCIVSMKATVRMVVSLDPDVGMGMVGSMSLRTRS